VLDLVDQRIVELLQFDGRMSNAEIGRRVGVAETTVRRRIERLSRDGVVTSLTPAIVKFADRWWRPDGWDAAIPASREAG
jgi:Lrp/AsnC family transcriptional regulator, leucine-responsive regulatory protein